MSKKLQRIHEYEADEEVIASGTDEKRYQMLLIQNISGNRYSGLTDGLNNCSLKKRIIMMKKTNFKKDWAVRGIAVCGFAILGGLIIHIPAVAAALEAPITSPKNVEKNITSENLNPDHDKSANLEEIKVEKVAEYEGGEKQLLFDLSDNIQYPQEAMKDRIEGRVVVRFRINTNGTISNCEVVYSQNHLLDEAALKAVENLPGKWKPAEVDNKPVASVFNIPVTFKLKSTSEESK